jgi:hypothetical protein
MARAGRRDVGIGRRVHRSAVAIQVDAILHSVAAPAAYVKALTGAVEHNHVESAQYQRVPALQARRSSATDE